jgi:hypothetical protein
MKIFVQAYLFIFINKFRSASHNHNNLNKIKKYYVSLIKNSINKMEILFIIALLSDNAHSF